MTPTPPDLALPLPLAVVIVVGFGILALLFVRSGKRRRRRRARRAAVELQRCFERFLDDGLDADALRARLQGVSSGVFWSALETFSARLRYVDWLRLSRALEPNRFSRAERRALRDESPWRRVLAARRVGLTRAEESRRALRRAMMRGPEIVTHAAAAALGRARDRGALRWLLRHPDALSRRPGAALVGLIRSFGSAGLPELAAALEAGLDSHRLERAVVEALGLGRHRAARPALEERLGSGDLDMRVAAVRALGRIQAIESGTSLLGALKDDAWQVRAQAAKALGRMRATVAVPALAARLGDPSWWVRHHAAYALRALGHDGQSALRTVIETSEDPYAREMAQEALEGGFPPGAARHRPRPEARRAS